MNRFTITIIILLIAALVGTIAYHNIKLNGLIKEEIKDIKSDINAVRNIKRVTVNLDSLNNVFENMIKHSQDSLMDIYDQGLARLRNENYRLKKEDEKISHRLDSLNSIMPSLPKF